MSQMRIKNLTKFAKIVVKEAAKEVGINAKNVNDYITLTQAKNLIIEHSCNKDGDLVVNDKRMNKIHTDLCKWFQGFELARLSAMDKFECYWDNEQDKMIFITN
jgi:hypothetical protein